MKHLVIHPLNGLCNRLRVIAAGLRLRQFYGAKLSIVFPEGDLKRLIKLPDDVEVLVRKPDLTGFLCMKNNDERRSFDYSLTDKVYTSGWARFDDRRMPPFRLAMYAELVKPSDEVLGQTRIFQEGLSLPPRYIGMHVRRGDHEQSKRVTPLWNILEVARHIIEEEDTPIALACEDGITTQHLLELACDWITPVTRKKPPWGGSFNVNTAISDFAELLLIARGEYVVGSEYSSYSRMAVSYNGNSRSFLIGQCKSIDT